MAVRTRIYPFEIVLPEVIENVENAPKKYLILLEEALDYAVKEISCRRVFKDDPEIRAEPVLGCPICGFEYMHMPAVALVTNSACVLTTKDGTKIIRSENLFERMHERGWRLVMFCECESGHTTKIIFQFYKGHILLLYNKMDEQKFRAITKGKHFEDIDRE